MRSVYVCVEIEGSADDTFGPHDGPARIEKRAFGVVLAVHAHRAVKRKQQDIQRSLRGGLAEAPQKLAGESCKGLRGYVAAGIRGSREERHRLRAG